MNLGLKFRLDRQLKDGLKAAKHTKPSTQTVVLSCASFWIPQLWILTGISYLSDVGVQMGRDGAVEVLLEHLDKRRKK